MTELAGNLGITDSSEITTMLEFYHDLGVIIYYDRGTQCVDNLLRNTVILQPQWLLEMFNRVLTKSSQVADKVRLLLQLNRGFRTIPRMSHLACDIVIQTKSQVFKLPQQIEVYLTVSRFNFLHAFFVC